MLRTKSIFEPKEPADGRRISIMSRDTFNDGRTPDPSIVAGITYDEAWRELAPPAKLVGGWYNGRVSWPEFKNGYIRHLRTGTPARKVAELEDLAEKWTVTVLCVEPRRELCHRRLLAELCSLRRPDLTVVNV